MQYHIGYNCKVNYTFILINVGNMLKYGILFLFVQYGIYRIEPCSTLNYQTFDTGYII